jgi:hypothetical protein
MVELYHSICFANPEVNKTYTCIQLFEKGNVLVEEGGRLAEFAHNRAAVSQGLTCVFVKEAAIPVTFPIIFRTLGNQGKERVC